MCTTSSRHKPHRNKKKRTIADSLCDSGGIQTHNLLIRSQMLYSVELRNLSWHLISELRVQRYYVFFTRPNFLGFFFKKGAFSLVFLSFLSLFHTCFSKKRETIMQNEPQQQRDKKNAVPHPCLLIYIYEFRYDRLQLEEIRWLSHENILPLQA